MEVKYSVPQGTILGPNQFNIYLSGLFSIKSQGDVLGLLGHADDSVIVYSADTWQNLKSKIESRLG